MINLNLKWIFAQAKVNLRSITFYMMCILLLIGFGLGDSIVREYDSIVSVPIISDGSEFADAIFDELERSSYDGYRFVYTENKKELVDSVRRGEYSCGIEIRDDEDTPIRIYAMSGTLEDAVVREIVFPIVQRAGAGKWLDKYMYRISVKDADTGEILPQKEAIAFVDDRYEQYLREMSLGIYHIIDVEPNDDNRNINVKSQDAEHNIRNGVSLRGVIYAFLILSVILVCIIDVYRNDKSFYKSVGIIWGHVLRIEKVLITVGMSALIAGVINKLLSFIH